MTYRPNNFLWIYRTSFSRALTSYVNNGFFGRDLDADDTAFIEGIRERGRVPCGSLANDAPDDVTSCGFVSRHMHLDEAAFWEDPSAFDFNMADYRLRKAIHSAQSVETVAAAKRIQLARIERRVQDKAMAAAELAREEAVWKAAREAEAEKRKQREQWMRETDREWEWMPASKNDGYWRHNPNSFEAQLRKKSRFYIPIWEKEKEAALAAQRDADMPSITDYLINKYKAAYVPPAPPSSSPSSPSSPIAPNRLRTSNGCFIASALVVPDILVTGHQSQWKDLDWWPPGLPDPGKVYRLIGTHIFCRNNDLQMVLFNTSFGHRLEIVRYGQEMCHLFPRDGGHVP